MNKKITELPIAPSFTSNLLFEVVDEGINKQLEGDVLKNGISAVRTASTKTTDFTILNNSAIGQYFFNASAKRVTGTLPNYALNLGQVLRFYNTTIGIGRVLGSVTNPIYADENAKTEINLYWAGDYLEIIAEASGWRVLRCKSTINGEMRGISDESDISSIASVIEVDIDNGTPVDLGYEIGELIEEATSGYQGRIYYIDDNGDGTGTLWTYDNDGNYTDGRVLTGQNSSATSNVNEASGTTKNLPTNFLHLFGENLSDGNLQYEIYFSSDGSENNVFHILYYGWENSNNVDQGQTPHQVSNNEIQFVVAISGIRYLDTNGEGQLLQTSDIFFKSFVRMKY